MGPEGVLAGRSKLSSGRPLFSSRMEKSSHELSAPRVLMSYVVVSRSFSTRHRHRNPLEKQNPPYPAKPSNGLRGNPRLKLLRSDEESFRDYRESGKQLQET